VTAKDGQTRVIVVPADVFGDLHEWLERLPGDTRLETEDGNGLLHSEVARFVTELKETEPIKHLSGHHLLRRKAFRVAAAGLFILGPGAATASQMPSAAMESLLQKGGLEQVRLEDEQEVHEGLMHWKQNDPQDADAHALLMLTLKTSDRHEEASEAYQELVRLDPPRALGSHPSGVDHEELARVLDAYEQHLSAGANRVKPAEPFHESLSEIAGAVSSQLPHLASAATAFAGLLLSAYLHGFTAQIKKRAEGGGRATARWLERRLKHVFDETQEQTVERVQKEVGEAAAAAATCAPSELERYAQASEVAIRDELLREGFSAEGAAALSASVRVEAARLVGIPVV
jgi:tetratricopeptide (TPR) repeat protein